MIVKPIPNFPGYFASKDGQIWSKRRMGCQAGIDAPLRALRLLGVGGRYKKVELRKNGRYFTRQVHTLILLTFVGPPKKGQECRHLNGSKSDNRLTNLQWGTRTENARDRISHGTQARGMRHGRFKLTDEQCLEILKSSGVSQSSLAKRFGVSQTHVGCLLRGTKRAYLHNKQLGA